MNSKELRKLLELLDKFGNEYEIETYDLQAEVEDVLNKDIINDEDSIVEAL